MATVMSEPAAAPATVPPGGARQVPLDALRGLIMVLMSLDHGSSPDFAFHVAWLGAGKWGLECAANLGQLYVAEGQPAKAEPLYRRALSIRQKALGPTHPEVAKTLEDLANVLRKLGRSNEAVVLDVQAREIRAKRS